MIEASGLFPSMLSTFSERNNFTFSYVVPEDNEFGTYDPISKSWTGAIGQVRAAIGKSMKHFLYQC